MQVGVWLWTIYVSYMLIKQKMWTHSMELTENHKTWGNYRVIKTEEMKDL